MTTYIDIIIATIIFLIIIIYNLIQKHKNKNYLKKDLYKKTKLLTKILYALSGLTFIIFLIINLLINGNDTSIEATITYILNALSISLIFLPISLSTLYLKYFKDEENYSHIKTIITSKITKRLLNKYNKAGINIIVLSNNEQLDIKSIEVTEFKKSHLKKTIQIKTDNLNLLDKYLVESTIIKETKNLDNLYNQIYNSRGIHDNYIKSFKYILTTHIPLIISNIILTILGFPPTTNILLISIIKLITIYNTDFVYKKTPYEKDIMERKTKPSNIIIVKQEILFILIESFCITFLTTIPYMGCLSGGTSFIFANTLYLLIYFYSCLFLTHSYSNDTFILINLIKSYKHLPTFIYTILFIIFIVSINFIPYLNTENVGLKNNISSMLFGLLAIILLEIIKLARFTTTKGKKKNEHKNNKKHKRSKLNNSR